MLAFIIESACVGCTLCLRACPEDAILGARKKAHRVIPEKCTGCELCVPACPIPDCLLMQSEGVRLLQEAKPVVTTAAPVLIADNKAARLQAARERAQHRRL